MKRIALLTVCLGVLASCLGLQAALIETRMATQVDQRNIARDVNFNDLGSAEPYPGFYADNKVRVSYGRSGATNGDSGPVRSLFKFTLPDAPADLAGPGRWAVTSATLSLYRSHWNSGTVLSIHYAADDTWKGAKGTGTAADKVVWATAPAIDPTPLDSLSAPGPDLRTEWDVLDAFDIHGELPGETLTLLLKTQEFGAPTARFEDMNYVSQGKEPRLTVQYEWVVPEPATLTMLGLGLTALSSRVLRRRRRD